MRTNRGKMFAVVLVLVIMLTFGGCADRVDLSSEELVQEVLRAQYEMETVRYTMEMVTTTEMELGGEVTTTTMNTEASGAIDFSNERMSMALNMSMPLEDGTISETQLKTYFLDGKMYIKVLIPDMPPEWTKMESPMGVTPIPIEQMIRLLETSELEILGIEEINGISCYQIKLIPDVRVFFEIIMQQMGMALPEEDAYIPEGLFKHIELRQWIARDTFLPIKETMVMTMNFEGMVSETTSTTLYYDHNGPISIELPPGAVGAEDMGMEPGFPSFEESLRGVTIPEDVTEADMKRLEELYYKFVADPENKELAIKAAELKEELGIR